MKHARRAAAAATIGLIAGLSAASTVYGGETVLYSFTGHADGALPIAGVTLDGHGNIFGAAYQGGSTGCNGEGCGTVFELTPSGASWTFAPIHTFQYSDGAQPWAAPILDAHGNLYGTTQAGGDAGCGVVYELSPTGDGQWTEKVLHSFNSIKGNDDGCWPYSALVFDHDGNIFGTTIAGGGGGVGGTSECRDGCGTVFELSQRPRGSWKERVLHTFPWSTVTTDGINPMSSVVFDSIGNLWGTTRLGGTSPLNCGGQSIPGCGILFRLSPVGDGTWKESLVYSFVDSSTGTVPIGDLTIDGTDKLYGVLGTSPGYGAAFEITPADASVSETLIHVFPECDHQCKDGMFPSSGLAFDAAGALYGTTVTGGGKGTRCRPVGCGTLYKLTPDGQGGWNEEILYRFTGEADGHEPGPDRLAVDAKGAVFGTAASGGDYQTGDCPQQQFGCGVVFKVK